MGSETISGLGSPVGLIVPCLLIARNTLRLNIKTKYSFSLDLALIFIVFFLLHKL